VLAMLDSNSVDRRGGEGDGLGRERQEFERRDEEMEDDDNDETKGDILSESFCLVNTLLMAPEHPPQVILTSKR
jgi:hypothetical protein